MNHSAISSFIWGADDLRGSVNGWDFKQYILGALLYRFISENCSTLHIDDFGFNQ